MFIVSADKSLRDPSIIAQCFGCVGNVLHGNVTVDQLDRHAIEYIFMMLETAIDDPDASEEEWHTGEEHREEYLGSRAVRRVSL